MKKIKLQELVLNGHYTPFGEDVFVEVLKGVYLKARLGTTCRDSWGNEYTTLSYYKDDVEPEPPSSGQF